MDVRKKLIMKRNDGMQRFLSEISYWAWVFILGAALGLALYRAVPQVFELEVIAQSDLEKAEIKCFWDTGKGISEQQSRAFPLQPGKVFQGYRFALPHRAPLSTIRLDPIDRSGSIRIQSIRLHQNHRLFDKSFDLFDLATNDHIASIKRTENGYTLTTLENGYDPMILLSGPFEGHVMVQSSKYTWLGIVLVLIAGVLLKIASLRIRKPTGSMFSGIPLYFQKHPIYLKFFYYSALTIGICLVVWQSIRLVAPRTYVDIDLQLEQSGGSIQLFWAQDTRFNEAHSRTHALDKRFHRYELRFEVPNHTRYIRLDLPGRQQNVRIHRLEIDRRPGLSQVISLDQPMRINQLTTEDFGDGANDYRITGRDPWLVFQIP